MPHRSRRSTALVTLLVCLTLTFGATAAVGQDSPDPLPGAPVQSEPKAVPARGLIVQLDDADGADLDQLAAVAETELPGDVAVAETASGPDGLGLLAFDEEIDAGDLDDAIDRLQDDPAVAWAVPNGVRFPSATANDRYYWAYQWNLNGMWGVRANSAWDVTTGSPSVRVAVVDTGIVASHPDLAGQYVAGRDFVDDEYRCLNRSCSKIKYRKTYRSAGDGSSWDASPADPGDYRKSTTCAGLGAKASSWHGTHVAGIIGAKRNNGIGIAGIAPGLKIQPVRAMGRCGGSDWDIAMSVLWAAGLNVKKYDKRHKSVTVNRTPAKVVNLSLGAFEPSLRAARQACSFYGSIASIARARGVTLVAAAGNQGSDHRLNVPSSCAGYIAVAATTRTGTHAFYSNQGSGIDIAAPGGDGGDPKDGDIASTWNASTTVPGAHAYGLLSGTSMAAPAVSAVAGLAYSVGIANPDVVERLLKATARRSSCPASQCGAGIVDANAVVRAKAPTSGPGLRGVARPGGTLTATAGTWRNTSLPPVLTWYRSGSAVASGTSTYRPTVADLGRRVTVRTTAVGGNPAIYAEAGVVVKAASKVRIAMRKTFKKSQRVKVKVRVTAPYVRPTGTVRVYDGKKRIATKKVGASGVVRVKLPKLKRKGKHRIRVVYSGNTYLTGASSPRKTVRVR